MPKDQWRTNRKKPRRKSSAAVSTSPALPSDGKKAVAMLRREKEAQPKQRPAPNPCRGAGCSNSAAKGQTLCRTCRDTTGTPPDLAPYQTLQHLEPAWERRAVELGLTVKVNRFNAGKNGDALHVLIDDAKGRAMQYWPGTGTVWSGRFRHKGKVGSMVAALELTWRLGAGLALTTTSERSGPTPAEVSRQAATLEVAWEMRGATRASAEQRISTTDPPLCSHCQTEDAPKLFDTDEPGVLLCAGCYTHFCMAGK